MNMFKLQQQSIDMMRQHQMSMGEGLQQLLISPREEGLQQLLISPHDIERAARQHEQGGSEAHELMRIGQEVIWRTY